MASARGDRWCTKCRGTGSSYPELVVMSTVVVNCVNLRCVSFGVLKRGEGGGLARWWKAGAH